MQDQDNLFPSNLSPNDFDVDIKHPSMTEDRRRLNPPSLIPPTVQGGRMMLCAPVRSLSEGWTETVPEMLRRGMQQCRQCKRLFHNKDSLNNHIKTNTMFTCPVPQCEGRGFRYRTDVVHHFHTVHRKEEMCSPACGRPGANAGAPPAKGPDVHVGEAAACPPFTASGNQPPSSALLHSTSLARATEEKFSPSIEPNIGTGTSGFLSQLSPPTKGWKNTTPAVDTPSPAKRMKLSPQIDANGDRASRSPVLSYPHWAPFTRPNVQTTDAKEARSSGPSPTGHPPETPCMNPSFLKAEAKGPLSSPPFSLRTPPVVFKKVLSSNPPVILRSPHTAFKETHSSNRPVTPHPPVTPLEREKTQTAATMDAPSSASSATTPHVERGNAAGGVQNWEWQSQQNIDTAKRDVHLVNPELVILQRKLDVYRQELELIKEDRVAERQQWDGEREGWEAEKRRWEVDRYQWECEAREWARTADRWAEDRRWWEVDREVWEADREVWQRDREVWNSDRDAWANDRKALDADRKVWNKERDEWVEDRELWEAEREAWDTDIEEWDTHMEECETHMEEWEKEREGCIAREDELLAVIARYKEEPSIPRINP